ncbi:PLC-like phosphodiesterase [Polyplosphaeria fusca]|uniref:PLC-like phosphodiesterase n=1 Tax=Polyplosphaeria fusca TaxID=682080 RepID=A0A9P4QWI5_9PLEO|nr:PLC-like phosphodiesterase [Polyplosphaeria fusca]
MNAPLTIRNLSPAALVLKGIERFEDPNSQQSRPTAFSFASANTASLSPSTSQLEEHTHTFKQQSIHVRLLPFESCTLTPPGLQEDAGISSTLSSANLRLTIEVSGGERYRIDTNPSYTQKASQKFVPLAQSPSHHLTALFHPSKPIPHLSIHSNDSWDLCKWMSTLPSSLPLSSLSIPGTHNSHTYYRALPSVRCQNVSVKSQLENGIRFLDIRVQPSHATDASKKDLYLVHGAFPISLTGAKYLDPVLKACYDFLEQNPSESVLISLKREGVGSSTDELLSQVLEQHYITPNQDKWYVASKAPYLGDVRGKLVLVRRYTLHEDLKASPEDHGHGLDATQWPHNSTHAMHGPFCVQDFCEVLHPDTIPQKLQYSNEHMIRAAECVAFVPGINTDKTNPVPSGPLYLNYLSASNFFRRSCWPENIAKVVNRGIEEWLCMGHHLEDPLTTPAEPGRTSTDVATEATVRKAKRGDGSTGIVVMDCVGEGGDWDLVKMIIGMNMGVRLKTETETS